jgi:pyruvate dehydrogenase E2 component (dihydrolipoamide acetyltransferase)
LTLEDGAEAKEEKGKAEERIEATAQEQDAGGVATEKPAQEKEAAQKQAEPEQKQQVQGPAEQKQPPDAASAERTAKPDEPQQKRDPVPASPSVRRRARALGVDIYEVTGSGPGGRISDEDVDKYARSLISGIKGGAAAAPATGLPATAALPDFSKWGEIERKPMSGVRRKTAENMRNAWLTVPHVTQHDLADITELEALRKRFSKNVEAAGGKLTVTAIALKVVAAALKAFPQFNASIDMAADEIVYKNYYHVGVAVDTDRGLLVPVIRDVDKKNIRDLSVELNQLAEKARNKKLSLDEMQGGTFTITNLGGIGGVGFTPIVNAPEVAILGISRASTQPVFTDGEFRPRLMLPLSLSYDHRLVDGADAARFTRWVAQALEQPFILALEG